VTAHCLVRCCLPANHNPLGSVVISEQEILDKSKADGLLKLVASLQIFWLLVSVITRKAMNLPISLLEVCTVAFAVLAVATYLANWTKPKDVDVPITLPNYDTDKECSWHSMCGESFFARILEPAKQHHPKLYRPRISNDMMRLQAQGTQHLSLTYVLALSTLCFGGIHCAAWQSYFPTQVERILWQVASVLSATLPMTNLFVVTASNVLLKKKGHDAVTAILSLMKSIAEKPDEFVRSPDQYGDLRIVRLAWIDDYLCTDANFEDGVSHAPCILLSLQIMPGR
jgi:hypothetical protein